VGIHRIGHVPRRTVSLVCAAAALAACNSSAKPVDAASKPRTTAAAVSPNGTNEKPGKPTTACPTGREATGSASVELEPVAGARPRMLAATYPTPAYQAKLWSQWGQGVFLGDGRYLSAVGDECGRDGDAFLYVFDPNGQRLSRVADVGEIIGHQPGAWGYGKIHAQAVPMADGTVYLSTYWGSHKQITFGKGYDGDVLLRYDPKTNTLTRLGVPVPRHGVPSLAGWPEGGLLYGEAVDPTTEDKSGVFFVYDVAARKTIFSKREPRHTGFRSILVTDDGRAMFSAGGGELWVYDPDKKRLDLSPARLPGDHLRAVTRPAPDGTVYGVTDQPPVFFALRPTGSIDSLGAAEGYTASLALDPSGRRVFYIPDAHGKAWEVGTPLMSLEAATGKRTVIARLNEMVGPAVGLTLGGTYNVSVDRGGKKVAIGLNAGTTDNSFGHVVLVVVEVA
jgi:hypothetical protein